MHIREFQAWSEKEVRDFVASTPRDEQADFFDALLFTLPAFKEYDDRHYFDDMDEYMAYLIENTRVYDSPQVIRSHELAHARCAEMLGATTVKFYTQRTHVGGITIEAGAYTQWSGSGPIDIPNIAYAAVAAAPKKPSRVDMGEIYRQSGYRDLGYLRERIEEWNSKNGRPRLPLPGELEE